MKPLVDHLDIIVLLSEAAQQGGSPAHMSGDGGEGGEPSPPFLTAGNAFPAA